MFEATRRIVTGTDQDGKSVVIIDGPPGAAFEIDDAGLAFLWQHPGAPIAPGDRADLAQDQIALCPLPGGSRLQMFALAPEDDSLSREELEQRTRAAFAAVGASDCQPDTSRHPAMHRTPTIDYIILLKGQVRLLLDNDERDLKPFDVVVQRGTNHAWINTGHETALLACVLIDAEIGA